MSGLCCILLSRIGSCISRRFTLWHYKQKFDYENKVLCYRTICIWYVEVWFGVKCETRRCLIFFRVEWCGRQKLCYFWSHALPISATETRSPSGKMCMDLTSLHLCEPYSWCLQIYRCLININKFHSLTPTSIQCSRIEEGLVEFATCMSAWMPSGCLEVRLNSSSSVW